jgi:hypothetical protein
MQAARPLPPVFSLLDGLKLINPIRRFKAFAGVTFSPSVYTLEAASDTVRRFGAAIRRNGLQRRPRQAVVRAARVGVRGCRSLADLRHAPAMAADPTELRVRRKAHPPPPTQRALASDARGRRSGRRPCVCLVLSSSAGARCAVVSSNATLFPPLEHSAAGRARRSASLACWRCLGRAGLKMIHEDCGCRPGDDCDRKQRPLVTPWGALSSCCRRSAGLGVAEEPNDDTRVHVLVGGDA